jgi:hypothetical protein
LTAAALSLLPARTTFQAIPRFVNHAFFEADLFQLPPDGSLNHRRYRKSAIAELERATPYVVAYANSFRLDSAERQCFALRTAQDIVHLAIFEHHLIAQMTRKRSRQPENLNSRVDSGTYGYVPLQLCYLFSNDHQAFHCSIGS